jgi:serine/threonine-protein kinase
MKTHLGHYEIVSELGRGGMGVVYKGYEPALTRYVAIKELSPALAHDAMLVERFLREARSMAALNDPHIIQIYFIGQENEQPFFVMEFVDGESLSGVIKRQGRLAVGDALKILHQSAQGLATAHDRGVIHRDIKPANLMINLRGQVKIADFGIALANRDFDAKLTGTGEFVGTPGYLSPEICLGKPVDQRSDIFALGIVLFEMLTGRTPFSDESPLKLMLDVVQSEIPDVRELNNEVDPDVAQILAKMVTKDPADRYQDTHTLIADLEKLPLVAQGGPLKLKPAAPSGPAATLIAMSTPVTPGVVMRAPTPPPSVTSPAAAAAAAAATAAGSTRPGVTQASAVPEKKSNAPMLIAAVVALLLIGSVWAMRGKLFGSAPSAPAQVAVNATDNNSASTNASPASPSAGSGNTQPASSSATPAAGSAPPATPPNTTASTGNNGPTPPSPGPTNAVGNTAASNAAAAPAMPTPPVPAAPNPPAQSNLNTAPLVASNTPVQTLRERIAERRVDNAPVAHSGPTRVAVEIAGDPAVTLPMQQLLEDKFTGAGMNVVENPARADVVVRVRAEVIGTQELQFYGQSATVTSAYLGVRPFGRNGQPMGAGFREKIDYTPLNAEAKVQRMMENKVDRLLNNVESKN